MFDTDGSELQIILPTTYIDTLGFFNNDDAVGKPVAMAITNALGEQSTVDATVVGVQEPTLFGATPSLNEALTTALYDAQNVGIPTGTSSQYGSATITFAADATEADVAALKADLVTAGYAGTTVADQIGTFQSVIDGIILVLNAFAVIALLAAASASSTRC
jgi:putative ABC transport system permease protein